MFKNQIGQESCCESDECLMANNPCTINLARKVFKQARNEKISQHVLGMYNQMRLQQQIQDTPYLNANAKKNYLYQNARLMDQINREIDNQNISLPLTFANLYSKRNANWIFENAQNISLHIKNSPFK